MKKQLLLLVSLLLPLVASADAVEIDGIYYNLVSEGQAEVTSNQSEYSGDITIPESVIYNDVTYSVTSIGNYAFLFCTNLTSIEIPNSVTSIGDEAFYFCMSLTSITIPNSVTSIGYNAFDETPWYDNQPDGLVYAGKVAYKYKGTMPDNTSIKIKEGTLEIVDLTFKDCSGLTSITIPNSVTSIGDLAFYRCTGLTSVSIKKEAPLPIGESTFSNRDNATLYVPYGCKAAYEAADYWKEFKSIIEFGDADGDGSVDVNDVTSTINYILNKPVAKFIIEAADMDQDGKIDVNDVQAIIYKALGK